jgi:hypothetical protein
VEEVGVHSFACGSAELAPEMPVVSVVDEVTKFAFAAGEEVGGVTHGSVVSSSRPVFRQPNRVRVSWAVPAHPLWLASRAGARCGAKRQRTCRSGPKAYQVRSARVRRRS